MRVELNLSAHLNRKFLLFSKNQGLLLENNGQPSENKGRSLEKDGGPLKNNGRGLENNSGAFENNGGGVENKGRAFKNDGRASENKAFLPRVSANLRKGRFYRRKLTVK